MSCEYCSMEIRKSGKVAWWQGADYIDGTRCASVQADDAGCENYELWVESYDEWNDELNAESIPITHCPWCGEELLKEDGDD